METFSLMLLGLGLVLAGTSKSITEIIKEEFSEEEVQYDMKQTIEVLVNLTLLDKNTSFSMSKDVFPSSPLTFRKLCYSVPKGNRPGNAKESYNNMTDWRKVLEANGSCKMSNIFIHGSMEVIHGVHKAPSCTCEQSPGMSSCESTELENTMCQLTTPKQHHRCQYHSHSLMSWLVSGSKL
uniref:Ribonuclease A family member 11 (inactive) n=1 Tax=Spermophilus dauricus TaxID=99837 RepID=A0A8C9PPA5_SPEDA